MSVNQKLENLLNLSLDTTAKERSRSAELETGYNPEEQTWELIVKYSGSLDAARELGAAVEEMRNEYAILTVKESLIPYISALPQIEYIEKPKRLFFAVDQAKTASCVNLLQEASPYLSGKGVLVAIVDSGIDYFHEVFRKEDGTTRILELWDQTQNRIYTEGEINRALEEGSREAARNIVPSVDASGHGTAVAGIAAGDGRGAAVGQTADGGGRSTAFSDSAASGMYRGIACESDLLVVKLGTVRPEGFPRTTELMRAVNYAVSFAAERFLPLVINISFGNTYGSHDGTSLLETFINDMSGIGRNVIVAEQRFWWGPEMREHQAVIPPGRCRCEERRTWSLQYLLMKAASVSSSGNPTVISLRLVFRRHPGRYLVHFQRNPALPDSVTGKHRSSCITGNRGPTAQPRSCILILSRMRAVMWRKESGAFI